MQITIKELDQKIKNGFVSGSYLFYGQEAYLKRIYLKKFRELLCPDPQLEAFSHAVIHGGDLEALESALSELPLFGGSKLIELRDIDFSKLNSETLQSLCQLLTSVEGSTVIIDALPDELPEGTAKKPSPPLAALQKVTFSLNFERQTPQKLAVWVGKHIEAGGCRVDPALCRYLVDTCSADMFILANEAEKICAYALSVATDPQTPPILTKEMILLVCSPNKIFGAFDFANAVLEGNTAAALSVFADMKLRKEKPQDIIATISRITGELLTIRTLLENGMKREEISSALKMADYPLGLRITVAQKSTPEALRDTFFRCLEADRKLKSTSLNGYLVIEHLLLDNYQDVQEESS